MDLFKLLKEDHRKVKARELLFTRLNAELSAPQAALSPPQERAPLRVRI